MKELWFCFTTLVLYGMCEIEWSGVVARVNVRWCFLGVERMEAHLEIGLTGDVHCRDGHTVRDQRWWLDICT